MTAATFVLLVLTLGVAVLNWVAVYTKVRGLELVAKPLTMVVLLAAALSLEPSSNAARGCFVVALVFSLAGDVFLMIKRDDLFVFGLASFLAGHVAYIVGLWFLGVSAGWLLAGVVVVGLGVVAVGLPVVRAVRAGEHAALAGPVVAYMGAISIMVAAAFGTSRPFAIVGALLFYGSDALIAWNRFVKPKPWADVVIMVTYHLAQIALVLALI